MGDIINIVIKHYMKTTVLIMILCREKKFLIIEKAYASLINEFSSLVLNSSMLFLNILIMSSLTTVQFP